MKPRLIILACAGFALAACGSDTKKQSGGVAGGEILPASVSDAMLPYDAVRSQAPLAPKAESGGDNRSGKDKSDNSRPDRKPRDRAEPAPEPAPPVAPEPDEPAEG